MKWETVFVFPFRLESRANERRHWRDRYRVSKSEHKAITYAWLAAGRPRPPSYPVRVTLTRIAPRKLDGDNLVAAFKGMRDALTRCLELRNDGGPEIEWICKQEQQADGYYVRVEIESLERMDHDYASP